MFSNSWTVEIEMDFLMHIERILINREKERLNAVFINLHAVSSEKSLYVIVMAVYFDGVSFIRWSTMYQLY